jgi:hypothetical protein
VELDSVQTAVAHTEANRLHCCVHCSRRDQILPARGHRVKPARVRADDVAVIRWIAHQHIVCVEQCRVYPSLASDCPAAQLVSARSYWLQITEEERRRGFTALT